MQESFIPPLPRDTARAVEFVAPECPPLLLVGDQLEKIVAGIKVRELDPDAEHPLGPLRMALLTFMQSTWLLSDLQALERVRQKPEWKYALRLPLSAIGYQPDSLCAFRRPLYQNQMGQKVLQQLAVRFADIGLFLEAAQSTDSAALLREVCSINRAECVIEAMRQALEAIALTAPAWLVRIARPHWYERFESHSWNSHALLAQHNSQAFAVAIGGDVHHLLAQVKESGDPQLFRLPEVEQLHQIWLSQFDHQGQVLAWSTATCNFCVYENAHCRSAAARYRYPS